MPKFSKEKGLRTPLQGNEKELEDSAKDLEVSFEEATPATPNSLKKKRALGEEGEVTEDQPVVEL